MGLKGEGHMEALTAIGLGLVLIGIVLIPFTCFTSLILSVIGIIIMVVGEADKTQPVQQYAPQYPPYPPQYPQQYPPQYPPQYQQQYPQQPPPPRRMCPKCGGENAYNAIACQFCGQRF